ncbi:MAG TPA: Flp family type IVb pilin [Sphingomicrobium sp.]|nr:Flp family type IVb pilin [Sphingomicrobium sp.]
MPAIRTIRRNLRSDKRGATVVEYGLIASLIIIAILGALSQLGGGAGGMWTQLDNQISDASD